MRVLLQSKATVSRRYGAAKLLLELADALAPLGAAAEVVGPETLGVARADLSAATTAHVEARWGQLDVVDLDYKHIESADLGRLRARRAAEGAGPAFVVRCQLWRGHLRALPPPPLPGLRARVGRALRARRQRARREARLARDLAVLAAADRVVVSNERDRADLAAHGLPEASIDVVAPGLDAGALAALGVAARAPLLQPPVVAFVGTFDERKGGGDFPALAARLVERCPDARLRLLGTSGRVPTAEGVLRRFPRRLRDRVEVVPRYAPDALPGWLAGCAVGVFPSYAEGFGYGVLEMLAAGVPVVAYDRPGPPAMLPPEWLVPAGRPGLLADRAAELLADPVRLADARRWARQRAADFGWDRAARQTLEAYRAAVTTAHRVPVAS